VGPVLSIVEVGFVTLTQFVQLFRKEAHGGLRTFLMERSNHLFDVTFPEVRTIGSRKDEYGFYISVKGDSDETLLNEFKRTQFFTKEEKEFLETYERGMNIVSDSYTHTETTGAANGAVSNTPRDNGSGEGADDSVEFQHTDVADLSRLTVVKLREICKERGLPVSGKKDEIIDRIESASRRHPEPKEQRQRTVDPRSTYLATRQAANRSAKRPRTTVSVSSRPRQSQSDMQSVGNNPYASTLPQLDLMSRSRYKGNSQVLDPEVRDHLKSLISEYLTASGGVAGSRDVGRYLAANSASEGQRSALTELKESSGGLLSFLLSNDESFAVLDNKLGFGGEHGFKVALKNRKNDQSRL